MALFDFKKTYKNLYAPTVTPSIVDVPEMRFIMIDGKGNPNTSSSYKEAVELLYGLSYAIRMNTSIEGYVPYVVAPLEGLWWFENNSFEGHVIERKDEFSWIMMIRQPDFVTPEVFENAKKTLKKKKAVDVSIARLESFTEGLCGQIIHIGSYDDEAPTIAALERFITTRGYQTVMGGLRQHHEIYLGDPRRTIQEKLKTIIRHPIEKIV